MLTCSFSNNSNRYNTSVQMTPCTLPGNVSLLSIDVDCLQRLCAKYVYSYLSVSPPSDKAKVSNCRVIVHCLAGISRSATIAIAYIMKTMGLSSDDAYRYASSSHQPPAELR